VWVSPEGCLMFSIQIMHKEHSNLVFLQYLMGLAIVDAIRIKSGYEVISFNDLLITT
jgi:biotin--protein ligase